MAVVPAVLSQKVKALADAQSALDTAKANLASASAHEQEMQRQYNWWNGEGNDAPNANNVYPQLIAARAATATAANVVNTAQANFNAAQKEYDTYINNLDPEDKKTLNEISANTSKAELLATSQVTTKYLIFGAIVLTLIIGAVIIIRSKKNLA